MIARVSLCDGASRLTKTRLWMSLELLNDDREALAAAWSDIRTVDSRGDLLRLNARADELHILLNGWAARYKLMKDGSRYISALMMPGDICDLDVLMFDRVDFGVTTLTECTFAVLPRQRVKALIDAHPRIGAAFLSLAVTENAILGEWAASVGRRSAHQRVGRLLCELLVRMKAVGQSEGNAYDLPLTQEHLGDATGLTAVHVNRILRSLRAEGLVTVQGRRTTIHDWVGLKAMCGFQPAYLHLEGIDDELADDDRLARRSNGHTTAAVAELT